MKKTVAVGMSGGVDSSVAAYLLKEEGYDVFGVFLRGYNLDGCAERDAEDARRAAEAIGIPFYVWNVEEEYKKKVVDEMIKGYREGITPNPDILCNRDIKFGIFKDRALALGADCIATGHYVQKEKGYLKIAKDQKKDQSYFLWTLTPDDIAHALFPIGAYEKPEVRKIAKKAKLPTADKKDSQGICFLGTVDMQEFLKAHIPVSKGNVKNTEGQIIGTHDGISFYTIGQRHGLHLGEKQKYEKNAGAIHYVAEKDEKTNTIIVAEGDEEAWLTKKEIHLTSVNSTVLKGKEVYARVRYRQPLAKGSITITTKKGILTFDTPQRFVAPGQSAVWYDEKGLLLGGGIIQG
jgi:tRNA-specific 2-thiouridylase